MYPWDVGRQQRCNKLYQDVTRTTGKNPCYDAGEGHDSKPVLKGMFLMEVTGPLVKWQT